MSLSFREIRWLVFMAAVFIGGWACSVTEMRYWWSGRTTTATVLNREEYTAGRSDRPIRMVALTYTFRDEETGTDREESLKLRLGTLEHYSEPEFEVQYFPGVEGASRIPSAVNRYFAVGFLLMNVALACVAVWGWRLMKADTWAHKPGRLR